MSESYRIVSEPTGEPLPAGRVGVRVLIPLSGCPSERWSRALGAHLVNEFTGHAAVGHLQLNSIVRADRIVLEGVEAPEAPHLGAVLRRAIDATNHTCERADTRSRTDRNVGRAEASAIASHVQPTRTG
jgi:hypothetical protein